MRRIEGVKEIKPFVGLDVQRLDRIAEKIVRGIFYHERGYPIPSDYKVLAGNLDLFMSNPSHVGLAKFVHSYVMERWLKIEPTTIGNDVFAYRLCFDDDDVNTVFMLLEFYGGSWTYCGLILPPMSEH